MLLIAKVIRNLKKVKIAFVISKNDFEEKCKQFQNFFESMAKWFKGQINEIKKGIIMIVTKGKDHEQSKLDIISKLKAVSKRNKNVAGYFDLIQNFIENPFRIILFPKNIGEIDQKNKRNNDYNILEQVDYIDSNLIGFQYFFESAFKIQNFEPHIEEIKNKLEKNVEKMILIFKKETYSIKQVYSEFNKDLKEILNCSKNKKDFEFPDFFPSLTKYYENRIEKEMNEYKELSNLLDLFRMISKKYEYISKNLCETVHSCLENIIEPKYSSEISKKEKILLIKSEFLSDRIIDLSGKDATDIKEGIKPGYDGKPGLPGQNSGILVFNCQLFEIFGRFQAIVDGGNGGKGGNGGDAIDINNELTQENYENYKKCNDQFLVSCQKIPTSKIRTNVSLNELYLYEFEAVCELSSFTGRRGIGGKGGYEGYYKLNGKNMLKGKKGVDGISGHHGKPGIGRKNIIFKQIVRNEKFCPIFRSLTRNKDIIALEMIAFFDPNESDIFGNYVENNGISFHKKMKEIILKHLQLAKDKKKKYTFPPEETDGLSPEIMKEVFLKFATKFATIQEFLRVMTSFKWITCEDLINLIRINDSKSKKLSFSSSFVKILSLISLMNIVVYLHHYCLTHENFNIMDEIKQIIVKQKKNLTEFGLMLPQIEKSSLERYMCYFLEKTLDEFERKKCQNNFLKNKDEKKEMEKLLGDKKKKLFSKKLKELRNDQLPLSKILREAKFFSFINDYDMGIFSSPSFIENHFEKLFSQVLIQNIINKNSPCFPKWSLDFKTIKNFLLWKLGWKQEQLEAEQSDEVLKDGLKKVLKEFEHYKYNEKNFVILHNSPSSDMLGKMVPGVATSGGLIGAIVSFTIFGVQRAAFEAAMAVAAAAGETAAVGIASGAAAMIGGFVTLGVTVATVAGSLIGALANVHPEEKVLELNMGIPINDKNSYGIIDQEIPSYDVIEINVKKMSNKKNKFICNIILDNTLKFEEKKNILKFCQMGDDLKEVFFKFHKKDFRKNKFIDDDFPLILGDNYDDFYEKKVRRLHHLTVPLYKVFECLENEEKYKFQTTSILKISDFGLFFEGNEAALKEIIAKPIQVIEFLDPFLFPNSDHFVISPLVLINQTEITAKVKVFLKLTIPSEFSHIKEFNFCKIDKDSNESSGEIIKVIKSKLQKTGDELYLEAELDKFCITFATLSWNDVQQTLKEKEDFLSQRLFRVSQVFDSNLINISENQVLGCLEPKFQNSFSHCLEDLQNSNIHNVFPEVSIISLTCIRLYSDIDFCGPLNENLRNLNIKLEKWNQYIKKMKLFFNSFIWGLKGLQYHWGQVFRGVNLKVDFKEDTIIRFPEILSCSKEKERVEKFTKNQTLSTLFIIKCQTGRYIAPISKFKKEEEVIFPPGTTFSVKKVEKNNDKADLIYLEEVILPFGDKRILWVDDFPENNKLYMEKFEKKGSSIYWRKSTSEVKELLRDFRPELLNTIKIITDMVRMEDGRQVFLAGSNLIKLLRDMGYHREIAIFCGCREKAIENCKQLNVYDDKLIKIFTDFKKMEEEFIF